MWYTVIIPALLLGGISSLHCVGMCGPLMLALPLHRYQGISGKMGAVLVYNAGRTASYAMLGCIAGLIGNRLLTPDWQQRFAILAGLLIILSVFPARAAVHRYSPLRKLTDKIILPLTAFALKRDGVAGMFLLGTGNGLLPCGLVFIALTAAFASHSVSAGVLFMIMYGVGTTPLMASLALLGAVVSMPLRNTFKKITPLLTVMAGVLLLLRGFNISIPYISNWFPGHKMALGCQPLN